MIIIKMIKMITKRIIMNNMKINLVQKKNKKMNRINLLMDSKLSFTIRISII